MQDVDRPAHVQTLPQPTRDRGMSVQNKPLHIVPCAEDLHGIGGDPGRRRDLRQKPAVRPSEPKLAVGLPIELVALFMDGAVMPATEQREIRERGGAALRPVPDVMALPEPDLATREATAAVAVVQRPS